MKCWVCGPAKCRHGKNPIPRPTRGLHYDEYDKRWVVGFVMPPRMLTDREAAKVVPLRSERGE